MIILRILFLAILLFHNGYTKDIRPDSMQNNITTANEVIAFSAHLSSHKQLVGDTTIEFDRVLANVGGRYSGNSGQFACLDDRVYVFIWSLLTSVVSELEMMRCMSKLRLGVTEKKFGPKSSYYYTGYSGVAEMTAILQCTTSEPTTVTVRTVPWSQELGSVSTYRLGFTSFSGFRLLHEVAFTAELSEDQYLFPGSKIRFDRVLSNYGEHYDDTHHFFQCPDDGVYVFSVSTHTNDSTTPWSVSRLMKDKEVVRQGPITYLATADYDSGSASTTTVLQCAQGSTVYVEAQAAHDFIYNSYGAELTSFTGFQLYNNTEDAVAFTAIMSNNFTTEYDKEPFVFDQIITNVGNAFDTNSSRFICPDDDYYLFTWTTTAGKLGESYIHTNTDLYMDETWIKGNAITLPSGGDESGTSGSSSMSVIQQCTVGSKIYVVGKVAHSDVVYLGGYTSFSGYKIPY